MVHSPKSQTELVFNREKIIRCLWLVTGILVLLDLGINLVRGRFGLQFMPRLLSLVDLDEERSIPTYFSVCLLLAAAMWLALIARVKKSHQAPLQTQWVVLGLGFFYLGFDELVGIHERISDLMHRLEAVFPSFPHTWAPVGLLAAVAFGLYFLPFLRHLPARTCRNFVVAGVIYVGGAVGMEILGIKYAELHSRDFTYSRYVMAEEGMEMMGAVFFIGELMRYYATLGGAVLISVKSAESGPVGT